MPLFSSNAGISARALGLTSGILSGAAAITSILGNQNGTTGTQLLVYFNPGTAGSSPVTDYQYSLNGGSTWSSFASPQTSSPLTISGLTNGTTYSVAIRPMQGLQASVPSNVASGRPVALPSTPSITSITNDANGTTGTQISVAFTGGTGGTDSTSTFQVSTDNGLTWANRSTGTTASPILVTGLTNGTSYNVRIRAVTSIGDVSAASAASTGRPVALPGAPTITGITASTGQISIAFGIGQAGTDSLSTYEYSLDGGSAWTQRATGATASPIVVTGITDSTVANANKSLSPTYSVSIRSRTSQNHLSAGSANVTPFATVPSVPTSLQATPTPTSITVTFGAPVSSSYVISSYEYSLDNSTWSPYSSGQTITGLTPSTSYTVYVRAVDAQSLPGAAGSIAQSTLAEVLPSAPTAVTATATSTTSVSVSYSPPTELGTYGTPASYQYSYSTDDGATYSAYATAGASPFTIPGLPQYDDIRVRMRAVAATSGSFGAASADATATTWAPAPAAPTAYFSPAGSTPDWGSFAAMTSTSHSYSYIRINKETFNGKYVSTVAYVSRTVSGSTVEYDSLTHTSGNNWFIDMGSYWLYRRLETTTSSSTVVTYKARVRNSNPTPDVSSYTGTATWTLPRSGQSYSLANNNFDIPVTRSDVTPPSCSPAKANISIAFPATNQDSSAAPGYREVTQVQVKFKCGVNGAEGTGSVATCNPTANGRILKVSYGTPATGTYAGQSNGSSAQYTASDDGSTTFGALYDANGTFTLTGSELHSTRLKIAGARLNGVTMIVTLTGYGAIWSNCTTISSSYGYFYSGYLVATGTQTINGSLSKAAGVSW